MSRLYFIEWIFLVLFWGAITVCFAWIGISNLEMFVAATDNKEVFKENMMLNYMSSGLQYLEAALFGIVFGSGFTFTDLVADKTIIRKKSIGYIVVAKTLIYFIALFLSGACILLIYNIFDVMPDKVELYQVFSLIKLEFAFATLIFFSILVLLTNFVLQLTRKLGPISVLNLVTGKYSNPREEEVVVIFIDLKDSTTIAEKLGHKKYSSFLQKCFGDLTDAIVKHKANVYQYVGDEVVLTWSAKRGLKKLNCINLFFAFEERLLKNRESYIEDFGVFPIFKAGLDMGLVTVVEIGEIKKQIALHGDVLNTASRIQHCCNKLNHRLLISSRLESNLPYTIGFDKEKIEGMQLKGKTEEIGLYKIDKLSNIKSLKAARQ